MANAISSSSLASQLLNQGGVAQPGGKMGKDEFLKLLTTQLRYQDPMDPMDGKDMAADLAQFSGLEQLLNINEQLEAQQGQYDQLALTMGNSMAMNTIGKTVVIAGDKVILKKDDTTKALDGQVTANITTSGNATLKLYDKSGKEVGSRSLGYLGIGRQDFAIGDAAKGLSAEGAYAFKISVTDSSGKDVPQATYTVGKIDGLSYGSDGKAALMMGPLTIDFGAIVEILS